MRRRTFLAAGAAGLVALIGGGVWSRMPVIPKRPAPDAAAAMGWIAWKDGRYTLTLPQAEMGQNVATALRQVACVELGVGWEAVALDLHATTMRRVKATVGSESIMLFAEPLAQACAALRDALAAGRATGVVEVVPRPVSDLRALRKGGLIGASPEIAQGRAIVTGAPLYAADIRLPGMLYGRVLRAPASVEVRSSPVRWDAAAAAAVPGFAGVVTECGPPLGRRGGSGFSLTGPARLTQWPKRWLWNGTLQDRICCQISVRPSISTGRSPHGVFRMR